MIRLAIHRPVLVAVVFLVITVFGVVSFPRIPIDLLPPIEPPVLSVVAVYPGAAAPDVEAKVTEELEDALGVVPDLEGITSVSRENVAVLVLRFGFGTDLDQAADEVRRNLEQARPRLPADLEVPQVHQFDTSQVAVYLFAVTAEGFDVRRQGHRVEELVVEPLRRVPGVGAVTLYNAPEAVVRVDLERDRLVARGLTVTEVAERLGAQQVDVPAGTVEAGNLELAVRLPGEADSIADLEATVLAWDPRSGAAVRLGDVARVVDGVEEQSEMARVDGVPAVVGAVMKRSGANSVEVVEDIRARLDALQAELPPGMEVRELADSASFIQDMVGNLERTVALAGLLVLAVVVFFLRRFRPSAVIALSIPTSMIIAFLLLFLAEFSLNAITLIAMALAIGMVVDNAIVVLENVTREVDAGLPPMTAAHRGTREVGGAITASTITTLVIFTPLVFVSGLVGVMFGQLAYVMAVTIGASLLVALTLTPTLAGRILRQGRRGSGRMDRFFSGLDQRYRRLLAGALRHPGRVLLAAGGILVATVGLVLVVGTDFMPKVDSGDVEIVVEMPVGTRLETTAAVSARVADAFQAQPEVALVYERAGSGTGGLASVLGTRSGTHIARVSAKLVPVEARDRSDEAVARAALAALGPLPEAVSTEVVAGSALGQLLGVGTRPIVVELTSGSLEALDGAAAQVEALLPSVPGIRDVSTTRAAPRPELDFEVNRDLAARAMVPMGLAAAELRAAMAGIQAARFSGEGGDRGSRDVVVRLRPEDRDEISDVGRIPVRSALGSLASLGELGAPRETDQPVEIVRKDTLRLVTIAADITGRALGDVAADVEASLGSADLPEAVAWRLGGSVEEQREAFGDLRTVLVLGFLLVYLVMAAQFESWLDPLVIMFSAPFAVGGALLFLVITGTTLSLTAFLGLIILLGVVVNNAIVLIEAVKHFQAEGMPVGAALETAGARRLRPVLMTTLTTAGGMVPLAVAGGVGAEIWGPMGITALGGLLLSTVVTLVLVPVGYGIAERFRTRVHPSGSSLEAAEE